MENGFIGCEDGSRFMIISMPVIGSLPPWARAEIENTVVMVAMEMDVMSL